MWKKKELRQFVVVTVAARARARRSSGSSRREIVIDTEQIDC